MSLVSQMVKMHMNMHMNCNMCVQRRTQTEKGLQPTVRRLEK